MVRNKTGLTHDIVTANYEEIVKNGGYFKSLDYESLNTSSEFSKATSYRFVNHNCLKAITKTFSSKKNISGNYLSTLNTHENICEAIELTKHLEGDYVEIGVFEGGSALTALRIAVNLGFGNPISKLACTPTGLFVSVSTHSAPAHS